MRRRFPARLAWPLVALALAGCFPGPADDPPGRTVAQAAAPAADRVAVTDAPGAAAIALLGPEDAHEPIYLDNVGTNKYRLRSAVDRHTGAIRHELFVEHFYGSALKPAILHDAERIRWQSARAADGTPLPFTAISHDGVVCETDLRGRPPLEKCHYQEAFAATLEHGPLRRALPAGTAVTFRARGGREKVVAIAPRLVGMQVQAAEAAAERVRGLAPGTIAREMAEPPPAPPGFAAPATAPAATATPPRATGRRSR